MAAACARSGRAARCRDAGGHLQDRARGAAAPGAGCRSRPARREPRAGGGRQDPAPGPVAAGTSWGTSRRTRPPRRSSSSTSSSRSTRSPWPTRLDRLVGERGSRAGSTAADLPAGQRRRRPGQGRVRCRRRWSESSGACWRCPTWRCAGLMTVGLLTGGGRGRAAHLRPPARALASACVPRTPGWARACRWA